jgi:hypothetical protein
VALQVDALPSKDTDCPVDGALGEYLNAAVGAGDKLTAASAVASLCLTLAGRANVALQAIPVANMTQTSGTKYRRVIPVPPLVFLCASIGPCMAR